MSFFYDAAGLALAAFSLATGAAELVGPPFYSRVKFVPRGSVRKVILFGRPVMQVDPEDLAQMDGCQSCGEDDGGEEPHPAVGCLVALGDGRQMLPPLRLP